VNVCWKLHFCVLIWCGFTDFENTSCVYCLLCVLKYSKQETVLVAMFVVRIV
jgi:hypothetical protein